MLTLCTQKAIPHFVTACTYTHIHRGGSMIDLKRSRVVGGEVYWKQNRNFQTVLLLNNVAIVCCQSDRDKVCYLFDLDLGKSSNE